MNDCLREMDGFITERHSMGIILQGLMGTFKDAKVMAYM